MTTITLSPAGRRLKVGSGTALQDVLFEQGVEFPCGGRRALQSLPRQAAEGRACPSSDEETKLFPPPKSPKAGGWPAAMSWTAIWSWS